MPRRKKNFPCGHKGYGRICHRCAQKQADWEKKRQHQQEWERKFLQDPVDLKALPKQVVIKARRIIKGLQNRRDYREFRGKRLRYNRLIISIPVTRNYRLLCRDCGSSLTPEAVVSHEDYNICKPGS